MDNPTTINATGAILAALIILVFTLWSGRVQKQIEDKNTKAQDEKANSIIHLQQKLIDTQKELYNQTTGGDDVCHIFIFGAQDNKFRITLNGGSRYPLHIIKITVTDISRSTPEYCKAGNAYMDPVKTVYSERYCLPNSTEDIGFINRPELRYYDFLITFEATNGIWLEQFHINAEPDKSWTFKFEIHKDPRQGGGIIYKYDSTDPQNQAKSSQ